VIPNTITRPLLAADLKDFDKIKFPVIVTPKLDGIRCLKVNGQVVTRTFKPIPNKYIRETLQELIPEGIDGEIMIRGAGDFNTIQSQVMSFSGKPDFIFYAFDYVKDHLNKPYNERLLDLKKFLEFFESNIWERDYDNDDRFVVLPWSYANNFDELIKYEKEYIDLGYEGLMMRDPNGKYKCGRSTEKEGILCKLKRFQDAEAEVIGFQEKMHNENIQEKNEFGLAKRSTKKEGMVPSNTLGSLIVRQTIPYPEPARGMRIIEFSIGSGMNDETRKEIWNNQDAYLGKNVKYKFQEMSKDGPRFPVFLGFRSNLDM
jgi:DNA ligase-1